MPSTSAHDRPRLSVAIITLNEEANLGRTLASVKGIADEIVVVDSGSTDRTCAIAGEYGARVLIEAWRGFAAQKNLALEKCSGDWILSLDADEEVSGELQQEIRERFASGESGPGAQIEGYAISRRNLFLSRWIRHGGFYPDRKVRLFRANAGRFSDRSVHESLVIDQAKVAPLAHDLLHHAYPTLSSYIEHMNRYSSLGAAAAMEQRSAARFSFLNVVLRPMATFIYNYFLRLGFLDGPEGLLLHLYHAVYVSWKYAKAWELGRKE